MDFDRKGADARLTPEAIDPAAQMTAELREHFRRRGDSRCVLVVDPACRALVDRPEAGLVFSEQPRATVPVVHDAFPPEHSPYLLELDLSAPEGARLLQESVRLAAEDREPARIARGQGQRIGGWLTSNASLDDIAAHWSHLVLQKDDQGTTCLLRFYDSRALALLWGALSAGQQQVLLGPVAAWHAPDACGRRHAYTSDQALQSELQIEPEQWFAIRLHGFINKAVALHMHETGRQPRPSEIDTAVAAALRAGRNGLTDPEDLVAFIRHALVWHPRFDAHPRVRALLTRLSADDAYSWLVSELSDEEIEEIKRGEWDESAQAGPAGSATRSIM